MPSRIGPTGQPRRGPSPQRGRSGAGAPGRGRGAPQGRVHRTVISYGRETDRAGGPTAARRPATVRRQGPGPAAPDRPATRPGTRARGDRAPPPLVLPFRVSQYVLDELIDWSRVPDDPIFQLVFPQHGMLPDEHVRALAAAAPRGQLAGPGLADLVRDIRAELNPHPAEQLSSNVPADPDGRASTACSTSTARRCSTSPRTGRPATPTAPTASAGPSSSGPRPALRDAGPAELIGHLRRHPDVSDVLVTGGDPMIMSTERFVGHVEPMLAVDSVRTIRIGTKALAYWPHRFVGDRTPTRCSDSSNGSWPPGARGVHAPRVPPGRARGPVVRRPIARSGPPRRCPTPRRRSCAGSTTRRYVARHLAPRTGARHHAVLRVPGPRTGAHGYSRSRWSGRRRSSPTRDPRARSGPDRAWPGHVRRPGKGGRRRPARCARRGPRPAAPGPGPRPRRAPGLGPASSTAAWLDELEPHRMSNPELVRAACGDRTCPDDQDRGEPRPRRARRTSCAPGEPRPAPRLRRGRAPRAARAGRGPGPRPGRNAYGPVAGGRRPARASPATGPAADAHAPVDSALVAPRQQAAFPRPHGGPTRGRRAADAELGHVRAAGPPLPSVGT